MNIIYISNLKVKANVKVGADIYRSDFFLGKDLNIESLGIEGDHILSPSDISTEGLIEYQTAINQFIEEQSVKIMRSEFYGCFYRVHKTFLEYAPMLDNGSCTNEWSEVEFPASIQELNRINEYFKTNFTGDDFEHVHGLE